MQLTLPHWNDNRFNIAPDPALLSRLTEQMERAGILQPATTWLTLPDEYVHGTMEYMLGAWCGQLGQLPLRSAELKQNTTAHEIIMPLLEEYIRSIDHCNLLTGVTLDALADAGWRVLDLESLHDFLIISAFFDFNQQRPLILEIGAGFGRFIEFLMLVTDRRFRIVNVDAVAVSMMYCYRYLTTHFPNRKIVLYDPATGFDPDYDVLIVPAWELDNVPIDMVDLAINIESMQEMNQNLVDYYLSYIENHNKNDGHIFLVNSREYQFIGQWRIPENWQCLFRQRTPRSWTIDHPIEVFRRTSTDQRPQNLLRAAAYRQDLCYVRLAKELLPLRNDTFSPHGHVTFRDKSPAG
jgi:hypothetical protein